MVVSPHNIVAGFFIYNKDYFNGTLAIPKVKVNNSYKHIGRFYYSYNRESRTMEPTIEMSRCYDFTDDQFQDILVHEMIHYYIASNGIKDNGHHGDEFMRMADDFNKKYKLNIAPTIDMSSYMLSKGKSLFMYNLRMMLPF